MTMETTGVTVFISSSMLRAAGMGHFIYNYPAAHPHFTVRKPRHRERG